MKKQNTKDTIWKNPITWVCILAIGYWVYTYHLEHAMGILPYAVLLLCPLMHLFGHNHNYHHHDHVHDHNHKSALIHVIADAFTSVLAAALVTGKYFGWNWADPIMGIVGSVVILKWAYGLCKSTMWELIFIKNEYRVNLIYSI